MTEAVILALIALVGLVIFLVVSVILVKIVVEAAPSQFKFWTEHGHFEISFDTKADK
ncbi:MAG: hypothetical protein IKU29_09935 [Parabacteroides sp.]|nr:hypothetical protein [Parabacteroides sp.]